MIIKKSISLIVLSLTAYSLCAEQSRDGAANNKDYSRSNNEVMHIRSSDIYEPQPQLSPRELDRTFEVSKFMKPMPSTRQIKSISQVNNQESASALSAASAGCSSNVFTGLSGTDFLNALKNNGRECIDTLFNDEPETLALGAYSDANFATVIDEIKAKTSTYNGTDADNYINAMYYWLKAYAFYDNRRFVTSANQKSITEAINALYVNGHFFDKTKENAAVVRSAMSIIKNANIAERFMHIARDLLTRFDESYEEIGDWGASATPLFWQALNSCSRDATCREKEHNLALINAITNFIYTNIDWLSKSDNDYHLFNLGYQLVNLHKGDAEPHFSAISDELAVQINKVLNTFGPLRTDKARTFYMAVFESIDYNRVCSTYDTCELKAELIAAVLDDRMTCSSGTLSIWAQDMDQAQLEWTCNSLGAHETYFHQTLKTNQTPVTPDDNDKLQMIIFNDKKEWITYGGALFNVSTSNGGTYREGDPSNGTPEATFYAYEDVPQRPIFDVWNLRHEYIHYLEGRFISKGSFRDSDDAGRTTWFGEGIAEYISLRNCNAGAVEEARTGDYDLSTIFTNEYGVSQTRIYDWGYLANRYMFEKNNSQFFGMLELFKEGEFEEYRSDVVDPWVEDNTFDDDFSTWLTTVESSDCTVDNTRPASPIEPVNIDDIQGSEQAGINACALGRPPESENIQPGKAICLSDTSNGKQIQLGLSVPSGLVNVSLEITLQHGSGNADLLHRWDSRPNSTTYDYISNSATNEETILVENVEAGWNYIHVPANNEFSDVTLLARYIQNDNVADNVLVNGVSKVASGERLEQLFFTMDVPENVSSLTFDMSGGTGDADLYVQYGTEPTMSNFTCRPYENGNNEHCEIENIQAGTYHVMVQGYKIFTDVNLVGNFNLIANNELPSAQADGPYVANVGDEIIMDSSSSSDSDGTIVDQTWDLGDGTTSNLANPSHAYATAGTYTITLTVTDNSGAVSSTRTTATITEASNGSGLQNGVVKQVSGLKGNETFYTFTVPAGASNLTVGTSGGTGDVELHVKFGSDATKSDYDCRPWKVGSTETCQIDSVEAGTYYIMLLGHNDFTDVNLVGNYTH